MVPQSASLTLQQASPVVKLEPHGDMYQNEFATQRDPGFMAYAGKDGFPIGKGHVELTTGEKVGFEFVLLDAETWRFILGN
jgi:hypothetical protein